MKSDDVVRLALGVGLWARGDVGQVGEEGAEEREVDLRDVRDFMEEE